MKPVISVILSAIYPEKWLRMYESLKQGNSTPFEIIFVGPNAPNYELPENFRFIQTDVYPVQCKEIACRAAEGEYVLDLADDFLFVSGFLNAFIDHTRGIDMDKHIIVGHLGRKWRAKVLSKHHLGRADLPIVGLMFLMKRSIWQGLGGLDRRLKAIYYNDDLALRFYEAGGSYILGDKRRCLANEHGTGTLTPRSVDHDLPVILKLWSQGDCTLREGFTPGDHFTLLRQDVVYPFSDEDILTINQLDNSITTRRKNEEQTKDTGEESQSSQTDS